MKPNFLKTSLAVCLFVLLGGSILQTFSGAPSGWGVDDAFIGYRYAKNLASGKGMVFNPGERVEGYSDFLYIVLIVPAFWVTDNDGVYFFSVLVNLISITAAFLLFVTYLRRRLGEANAVAGAILFALCLPVWVAVAWGLETPFVFAISIAVWVAVERVASDATPRAVFLFCLTLVLSLLARVDGFIIAGVALIYLGLKKRYREAALGGATAIVTAGVFELWRCLYYGALLPTTYYVKVAGTLGPRIIHAYQQLSSIALFEGLLPLLLVVAFALVEALRTGTQGWDSLAEAVRFDLVFPPVWVAYWFYIGGDMYWDRFLLILFPLGTFTLLKFLSGNAAPKVVALVVLTLALLEVAPPLRTDSRFQYQFDRYDCWIVAGKFLGRKFPEKVLATGGIGKIPFFSGLVTEDMLGLTDPVIAHLHVNAKEFDPGSMKFDPDYTLSRQPDVIANWIHPNLDTNYGLSREKYERAGYHVGYLIDTGGRTPAQSIIDVEGADERTLRDWVGQGYNFAVLIRK